MRTLKETPFTRRSLIQGLGIGAGSMALPRLGTHRAYAAGNIPTRFVVFSGGGSIQDDCWPKAPGGGAPSETGWELGEVHTPLAPLKQKCLFVDGISMVSNRVDPNKNQGNAHDQGTMHALAASSTSKEAFPGGPSIDQFIAQGFNKPNPVTKIPSLQMLMGYWLGDYMGRSPFSASANTTLPMDWDPRDTWKHTFADFTLPAAPGMTGPSLADVQREQQLAVLGLAKDDFGQLAKRLGKDDRTRLDIHGALLSDLQKRMQLLAGAGGSGAVCTKPMAPTNVTFGGNSDRVKMYTTSKDSNPAIGVAALACDLTRVLAYSFQMPDEMTSFQKGMFGMTDLHGLNHSVCDPGHPLSKDNAARRPVKDATIHEATVIANFAAQLDKIPEADGTTLLDHTIILFSGHIGYGNHALERLPWVVIGGGATGLRLGRYIKVPKTAHFTEGRPHNDFLLALAHAAGVKADSFGNPDICSGPIREMLT